VRAKKKKKKKFLIRKLSHLNGKFPNIKPHIPQIRSHPPFL
jgi:hypothetical protein